jgi:hypothetical protein
MISVGRQRRAYASEILRVNVALLDAATNLLLQFRLVTRCPFD